MKTGPIGILLLLVLAGCVSNPNIHNASDLPESELATVRSEDSKWWDSKIAASIVGVYSEDGEEVIGTSFWGKSEHNEVKLEPGNYLFVVYCGNGGVYAYPRAIANLSPSKAYIVSCVATTREGFLGISQWDKVRAEVREFGHP